jgi:hypothetical protein
VTRRTKEVDESVVSVSNDQGGTVSAAKFWARSSSEGDYRLFYELTVTGASSSATHTITLGLGTTFSAQVAGNSSASVDAYVHTNSGVATLLQTTGSATTTVQVSGSAPLAAKPPWFDANAENSQSIDAQVKRASATEAGVIGGLGGIAAETGDVGEIKTATISDSANDAYSTSYADFTTSSTITLEPGQWRLDFTIMVVGGTASNNMIPVIGVTDSGNTLQFEQGGIKMGASISGLDRYTISGSGLINVTSTTTYKLRRKYIDIGTATSPTLGIQGLGYTQRFVAVRRN